MSELDPFKVLNVAATATREEIKAAWRARLREHHPDRFAGAPAPVRAAAEGMTELINGAYTALQNQGSARSANDGRPSWRPGEIPKAQALLRQTHVLIEYADALMERWRSGLALVRNRRRAIDEGRRVIQRCLDACQEVSHPERSLLSVLRDVARQIHDIKLIKPVERVLAIAEGAAARADRARSMRANQSIEQREMRQAQEEARHCRVELSQLEEERPVALVQALTEAKQEVAQGLSRYEERLRLAGRSASEADTAIRRIRQLNRAAQNEGKGIPIAITAAREAVDRALLMAGTALGLARVERETNQVAEEIWRSDRVLADAERLFDTAERLDKEQSRADEVVPILGKRMEEIRTSAKAARADSDRVAQEVQAAAADYEKVRPEMDSVAVDVCRLIESELLTLAGYVSDSIAHVEAQGRD